MLNPKAPPFEYSPPPPTLPPPPQPHPFVEYFPPFPQCPLSPPYLHPPPFSNNFFVYLTLRPPMLPPLPTEMSSLTIAGPNDAARHVKDQEVELHPDNDNSNLPPPPPPPRHVYPRKKDIKPRYKKRSTWIPRAAQNNKQTKQLDTYLEFDKDSHSHQAVDQRTTVMIRNIPNKFSRDMLIELLDKHCAEENKEAGNQPSSAFDFVYLPVDFKNGCNLGYAFVNFTSAAAARRLYDALHHHKWMLFSSSKISHVCYARIQGRRALEENFKYSIFRCDADEYFPVVLSPPRDGCTSLTAPVAVGNRYRR